MSAHNPPVAEQIVVTREDSIAIVQLNRPEVLNALDEQILGELANRIEELDADESVRCILITGNDRAFAAGADIKALFAGATAVSAHKRNISAYWERLRPIKTPLVAAVSGYALGGGCELAMLCDVIVCSETAQFGQPEVNLGLIPGVGGTQRLVRAVGKYLANDLILTGRLMKADEAKAAGLVARVFPAATWMNDAKEVAKAIASKAPLATQLASELVDLAQSTPLDAGLLFERRAFTLLFATDDTKEGVDAFLSKRKAEFTGH